MKELRLMNRDCIDSIIRTEEGMKHLVVDGEIVCSAPIAFDFNTYNEINAVEEINKLMTFLWLNSSIDGRLTYMDDLNDEMIQPLIYQVAYERAKSVVEDFNDEVYQVDMRDCGERFVELSTWDKRFIDCAEYYEDNTVDVCKWFRNR